MQTHVFSALVACALSFLFCKILIPVLRRLKAGQNILSYVKEHKKKSGTPTMGGLAFILSAVFTAALFTRESNRVFLLTLVIGLAYMAVGLIDDTLKQKHKENLGLRAWQKFAFQTAIAVLAGIACVRFNRTSLYIPFTDRQIQLGVWVVPLTVFVFLATVNAVNLTDGLDGLAASVSVPYFLSFAALICLQSNENTLSILCFTLAGALLAYLLFNVSPASVFMGDTGSLALGGFAACIGCFSGNTLHIAIIGAPFVLSVVSVIIQVLYFKATKGKRVFLMSPIHHHFQKKGFSESKISYAYGMVTLLIGAMCIACVV